MDHGELGFVMLFLGAVFALPTGVLVFIIATDDGGAHRFRATPRQPIQSAQGQLVKIAGQAAAVPSLIAPFSGREVVWFQLVVTEHERYLEGTSLRERITRHLLESSRAPFTITDESGGAARIVVDDEELFPTVTTDTIDVGGRDLPQRVQRALDERGIATRAKDGQRKRLVCIERRIEPGDTVIAIGPARRVTSHDAGAAGYRHAPTELVVGERGPDGRSMFVLTNGPESELGASDRRVAQVAWALGLTTLALLGGGSWLFFG